MTDPHRFRRLGHVAMAVLGFVLGSAIMALAQDTQVAIAQQAPIAPVRIELAPVKLAGGLVIPGRISQQSLAAEAMKKLVAEHRCLSDVIYYEARGEGEEGQTAVAQVIFHRLASGQHGKTVCAVVYEGAGQTFCQFTFACDGSVNQPRDPEAWRAAQVLAARLLVREMTTDLTDGATYYHTPAVHPTWAPRMQRVIQIGNHIFYRARGATMAVVFRGSLQ